LDVSEGAFTERNFPARCLGVKQHGVIMGMQMQCNRMGLHLSRLRGRSDREAIRVGALSTLFKRPLVNTFLTINRAKIAQ